MTKNDLVNAVAAHGLSKRQSASVVESVFEIVKRCLEGGQKVKISGFGNFVVHEKRPRKGRNPQTGEEIVITGRKVLSFKASQVLKKTMNGETPSEADRAAEE